MPQVQHGETNCKIVDPAMRFRCTTCKRTCCACYGSDSDLDTCDGCYEADVESCAHRDAEDDARDRRVDEAIAMGRGK